MSSASRAGELSIVSLVMTLTLAGTVTQPLRGARRRDRHRFEQAGRARLRCPGRGRPWSTRGARFGEAAGAHDHRHLALGRLDAEPAVGAGLRLPLGAGRRPHDHRRADDDGAARIVDDAGQRCARKPARKLRSR
jgi:hypothetical protein